MLKPLSYLFSCFAAVILIGTVGCQPPAAKTADGEHDHAHIHDHPDNYSEAVHEIEGLNEQIKTEFEAGKGEDAHDALHEVGQLLEELEALAKKDGVSGDDLNKIVSAAEQAFAGFSKLDTFHGESEEVAYSEVGDSISEAMTTLESFVKEGSGHDHDDDHAADHDEHDGHDHDEDGEATHEDDHDEGHDHEHDEDSDHGHEAE